MTEEERTKFIERLNGIEVDLHALEDEPGMSERHEQLLIARNTIMAKLAE